MLAPCRESKHVRGYLNIHAKYEDENTEPLEIRETVKQKLVAKAAKLRAYTKSYRRRMDNRVFRSNEKKFYRSMGKEDEQSTEGPTKEAITKFWSGIWSHKIKHNEQAHWIKRAEESINKI